MTTATVTGAKTFYLLHKRFYYDKRMFFFCTIGIAFHVKNTTVNKIISLIQSYCVTYDILYYTSVYIKKSSSNINERHLLKP